MSTSAPLPANASPGPEDPSGAAPSRAGPSATVHLAARIGSQEVQMSATVPAGPTRLDELMPLLQILSDSIVGIAESEAQERGACISCKKGCGACCRQLVPLSPVEARHVTRLVRELPEPRRSQIISRFAAARSRLEETSIWEQLNERREWGDEDSTRVGLDYFRLGIACPFLEDESCSIHRDRPLACREFLVTSPAENCSNPTPQSIDWLPLAAKVWVAAARCEPAEADTKQLNWVPLIQSLEWALTHSEPSAEKIGPELFRQVIEGLAGSGSPPRADAARSTPAPALSTESDL